MPSTRRLLAPVVMASVFFCELISCPAHAQVQGSSCNTLNQVISPVYLGHPDNKGYICDGSQLQSLWSATSSPLAIDFLGNVGIGTTAPTYPLSIVSSGTSVLSLQNTNPAAWVATDLYNSSGAKVAGFGWGNASAIGGLDNEFYFNTNSANPIGFFTNSSPTPTLLIAPGGLVGIGTTSPGALLDLGSAGTTRGTMRMEGNTSGYVQVQPAAAAGSWTMTLPTTTGTSGYCLLTDGSGNTSWGSCTGSGTATIYLGTTATATNPSRTGTTSTGFYSANAGEVDVAGSGSQIVAWTANGEEIVPQGGGLSMNSGAFGVQNVLWIPPLSVDTSNFSLAVGQNALVSAVSGDQDNTALGQEALYGNGGGSGDTAVGAAAMQNANTGASSDTAVGYQALANTSGYNNVAIGANAGYNVAGGTNNIAILGMSGSSSQTLQGLNNIAIGNLSMEAAGGKPTHVGFGSVPVYVNANIAIGGSDNLGSLDSLSSSDSSENVAIGNDVNDLYPALAQLQAGSGNTAVGGEALINLVSGDNSTAIGDHALLTATGSPNTALGYQSGYDVTTGSHNILIGDYATTGVGITTGSNNILMGQNLQKLTPTSSNQLDIGNLIFATGLSSGTTMSTGNVGIGTTSPGALLDIGSAGTIRGTMRMEGSTSGYVQVQPAAAAGSWTMTLPTNAGTSGYCLLTDGSGNTSWGSCTGGSTPSAFAFTNQTGVNTSSTITSNAVTLSGFTGALTATCGAGCTAIAHNGTWGGTTVSGFQSGDTIAIQQTSSASASTTTNATVTVGTTVSGTWAVTTNSTTAAAFSFTNQTSVTPNIPIASNAVSLSGFTGTLTASCNTGCVGIAINGVWGGTVVTGVSSGATIAIKQISAAADNTTTNATVTVGSTVSGTWSVTTNADACPSTNTIGTVCGSGLVYAGLSPDSGTKMYTTPCDAGQYWNGSACTACSSGLWSGSGSTCTTTYSSGTTNYTTWNNGTGNWILEGYTNASTGKANTAGEAAVLDASSPLKAANYCATLNAYGYADWYLPAQTELNVLYINKAAIGNFDTTDGGTQVGGAYPGLYWSSSEASSNGAWNQRFSDGYQANTGVKYYLLAVRCTRR